MSSVKLQNSAIYKYKYNFFKKLNWFTRAIRPCQRGKFGGKNIKGCLEILLLPKVFLGRLIFMFQGRCPAFNPK